MTERGGVKEQVRAGENGNWGPGLNNKLQETGEELWESSTISLNLMWLVDEASAWISGSAPLINNNSKSDLQWDTWF